MRYPETTQLVCVQALSEENRSGEEVYPLARPALTYTILLLLLLYYYYISISNGGAHNTRYDAQTSF